MEDDNPESNYKKMAERTRKLLGYDEAIPSASYAADKKKNSNKDK